VLENANVTQADIQKKQAIGAKLEAEIDVKREGYKPVAQKTAGLFFSMSDLSHI
jgi:hypothetical protein